MLPASPVKPEELRLIKGLVICGGGGVVRTLVCCLLHLYLELVVTMRGEGFGGFEPRLYLSDDTEMQIRGELDFI